MKISNSIATTSRKIVYSCIFLLGINGCCTAPEPVVPAIETPSGYDLLNTSKFETDISNMAMALSWCTRDSGKTNLGDSQWHAEKSIFYLPDTLNKPVTQCIRGHLKGFDFDQYDFLYVYHGSVNDIVRSAMDFRLFINHEKKEILLKSIVVGTGGCSGSGLSGRSYYSVLQVPNLPAGYTFKSSRNR